MNLLGRKGFYGVLAALLLTAGLLAGGFLLSPQSVYAAELAPDWDDPEYVKMMEKENAIIDEEEEEMLDASLASGSAAADPFTGKVYNHGNKLDHATLVHGVDVSKWHPSVNWAKVKAAGIEFAILRIGFSTTGNGTLSEDPYFESHLKGARGEGMKVGIYYFSQATSAAEAKAEAEYTLKLLDGRQLDLPIVFDYETKASYRNYGLSAKKGTEICKAYCDVIRAAGYETMVYASQSVLINDLYMSQLEDMNQVWIARYNTTLAMNGEYYSGSYEMWQYTEDGNVPGIGDDADCNFWYVPIEEETAAEEVVDQEVNDPSSGVSLELMDAPSDPTGTIVSETSIMLQWNKLTAAEGYQVFRSTCYNGEYLELANTTDCTFVDEDLTKGKEYYYKIKAYRTDAETQERIDGRFTPVITMCIPLDHTYYITTTAPLFVRTHAGTEFTNMGSLAEAAVVPVLGISERSNGSVWYHVRGEITENPGEIVEGYVCGYYTKYYLEKVTGLTAKPKSATAVTLTWDAQENIDGYAVYRADQFKGKYKRIKTLSANVTSLKNSKLEKNAQYYYKVRSFVKVEGTTVYGSYSAVNLTGGTETSLKVRTKVASKMNYWTGTTFKKLCVVPRYVTMTATKKTMGADNVWWYYCTGKVNGKTVSGYVSSADLVKISS